MIRRWLVFGLCMLIAVACGNQEPLKVGVESSFQPFAYVDLGQEKGFEVELWQAVAHEEKLEYEFVEMEQGQLLSALSKGEIDVALAGLTIKGSRKKMVDFTIPYYHSTLVMMVQSDNDDIRNISDLKDKVIATKIGSSTYDYAQKIKDIKQILAYPTIKEAYTALTEGDVDVVIFDKEHADHFAATDGQGDVKIISQNLTKESYAFALQKQSKYTGRINAALEKLGKNGTYERVYSKWFKEKPTILPTQ